MDLIKIAKYGNLISRQYPEIKILANYSMLMSRIKNTAKIRAKQYQSVNFLNQVKKRFDPSPGDVLFLVDKSPDMGLSAYTTPPFTSSETVVVATIPSYVLALSALICGAIGQYKKGLLFVLGDFIYSSIITGLAFKRGTVDIRQPATSTSPAKIYVPKSMNIPCWITEDFIKVLSKYRSDGIEMAAAIFAHEIGHWQKMTYLSFPLSFNALRNFLAAAGAHEIAHGKDLYIRLLTFIVISLSLDLVFNYIPYCAEKEADRFAHKCGFAKALAKAFKIIAQEEGYAIGNDTTLNNFFSYWITGYPALIRRINEAESYDKARDDIRKFVVMYTKGVKLLLKRTPLKNFL